MTSNLAYDLGRLDPPHDMRTAAVLKCYDCPTTGKVMIAGKGNNPEWIGQQFVRLGWDCDPFHRSRNWCPKCVNQRKVRAHAEAEALPKPRVLPTLPAVVQNAPKHFEPLVSGTRSSAKGDQVTDVRALKNEQKGLLRTAIEAYFDPDTGRFSEGWSDHRISEETNIPRKVVIEFREMFYGELLEDPEIKAFKATYDDAKKVMGNLQSSLQKMEIKLEALLKKHGVN